MISCIDKSREEVCQYAPKIIEMNIKPEKMREVIGAGGKVINKIIDKTGVKVDINDDSSILIAAENVESVIELKN